MFEQLFHPSQPDKKASLHTRVDALLADFTMSGFAGGPDRVGLTTILSSEIRPTRMAEGDDVEALQTALMGVYEGAAVSISEIANPDPAGDKVKEIIFRAKLRLHEKIFIYATSDGPSRYFSNFEDIMDRLATHIVSQLTTETSQAEKIITQNATPLPERILAWLKRKGTKIKPPPENTEEIKGLKLMESEKKRLIAEAKSKNQDVALGALTTLEAEASGHHLSENDYVDIFCGSPVPEVKTRALAQISSTAELYDCAAAAPSMSQAIVRRVIEVKGSESGVPASWATSSKSPRELRLATIRSKTSEITQEIAVAGARDKDPEIAQAFVNEIDLDVSTLLKVIGDQEVNAQVVELAIKKIMSLDNFADHTGSMIERIENRPDKDLFATTLDKLKVIELLKGRKQLSQEDVSKIFSLAENDNSISQMIDEAEIVSMLERCADDAVAYQLVEGAGTRLRLKVTDSLEVMKAMSEKFPVGLGIYLDIAVQFGNDNAMEFAKKILEKIVDNIRPDLGAIFINSLLHILQQGHFKDTKSHPELIKEILKRVPNGEIISKIRDYMMSSEDMAKKVLEATHTIQEEQKDSPNAINVVEIEELIYARYPNLKSTDSPTPPVAAQAPVGEVAAPATEEAEEGKAKLTKKKRRGAKGANPL